MKTPKVSCICLTENRVDFLKKAIECFKAQTYSERELVIVYPEYDYNTTNFLSEYNDENIKKLVLSTGNQFSLGEKRNYAINNCTGDYICNWDDDDWYHQDRLIVQINSIHVSHKPVSLLAYILMYDKINKEAYLSDLRMWENTLFCHRSIFSSFSYAHLDKSEDEALINELISNNLIYPVIMPQLYVYVFHGKNTWHEGHFNRFYNISQKLMPESAFLITKVLGDDFSIQEGSGILSSGEILSQFSYV